MAITTNEFNVNLVCPKCSAVIPLTDTLAAPMVERVRAEMQGRIDMAISQAEEAQRKVANKEQDLAIAMADVERDVAFRVSEETDRIRAAAIAEAANRSSQEVSTLRTKLAEAQQAQAMALAKERDLADRERELTLTIQKQVSEQVETVRSRALQDTDATYRLKLLEKDTLLESLQNKVTELNQKITQGSQQLQGEVQELDLEAQLRAAFPHDVIEEVGKGVNGADVRQTVQSPTGPLCGLILYESKRTKNWSPGWLPKLREDGRKASADLLVIVSQVLPEDIVTTGFGLIDGVWVCSPVTSIALAVALRSILLAVHNTKQVQEGMKSKSEEVYAYVTGPQFRHRVEALVEAFTGLQEDLRKERAATERQWAKREAWIDRVLVSTSGMFGDLQGIAGKALPAPSGLELEAGGGE